MKSLRKHIEDLNQNDWDYYSDISNKHLSNPLLNGLSHESFIKKYFKRSGKEEVLEYVDFIPKGKLDENRLLLHQINYGA